VQAALWEMADRLQTDWELVESMYGGLTAPVDVDACEERRKPYNVTVELLGGLENLYITALPDLIEEVRGLARVTDSDLERNFEHQQACVPREQGAVDANVHQAARDLAQAVFPLALSLATRAWERMGEWGAGSPRKELPARTPSAARRGGGEEGT
jgi:hypothetical protein